MSTQAILVFLLALSLAPMRAHGQAQGDSEARAAAARKLIEVTGAASLGLQAMDSVIATFRKTHPEVPEAFWTEFRTEVRPELLTEATVPIYAKYLSLEELQQLASFSESPLGRKLLQVQPAILQESMAAGQQWGGDIARRILQRLKEKGFAKAVTD